MKVPNISGAAAASALAALSLVSCQSTAEPKLETSHSTAALWADATAETIGKTAEWTNKVDLADLNGDGLVDILFANGGNYKEPGTPVPSRIFLNQGPGKPFREATGEIFGSAGMLVRVIKTADVNSDGNIDIFIGATYQTQSRLLLGRGAAKFEDVTNTNLPAMLLSLGDVEFGDVDLDGDLDLVLADWGPGSPMENEGGPPRLWLNDGTGKFSDAPERIPRMKVRFSWDIEFADVDNDYDLDLMISSKKSTGSFLLENDGKGIFKDVTEGRMPQYTNNYEFEPMDLNGDGFVDTATINDGGEVVGEEGSHRENIFLNDGHGGFLYSTPASLPDSENLGYDDNRVVYLDYDSDGDADVLIGSLSGPDRLLINDGKGIFKVVTDVVEGPDTKGTLCLALADLNSDGKLDIVMAQGEVSGFEDEKIYFSKNLGEDKAAPIIRLVGRTADGMIRARVHDNKAPLRPFDFKEVALVAGGKRFPMTWYGEQLWSAKAPADTAGYEVCATDFNGNQKCMEGK